MVVAGGLLVPRRRATCCGLTMALSAGPNRELFKLLQSLHAQISAQDTSANPADYRGISDTLEAINSVAQATVKSDRRIDVKLCTSVLFVSASPPNLVAVSYTHLTLPTIYSV